MTLDSPAKHCLTASQRLLQRTYSKGKLKSSANARGCGMRSIGLAILLMFIGAAGATAQVVALGGSATDGYGLSRSEAYPAQLQDLLHAKGVNVTVSNQGISGDTTFGMLGRVDSAAPEGTRVVIFQPGGNDNKSLNRRNFLIDHDGNIKAIIERLRARGIVVLAFGDPTESAAERAAGAIALGPMAQGAGSQANGGRGFHPDAQGYGIVAARLLPYVIRALGTKG